MAMTKQEYLAKQEILKQLSKEGYPTYANLLDLFHVNLTSDPGVVAYMEPGKGRIVVNRGLNIDQVSTIVRHEILHEYLNHHNRLINHIAKSRGLDPNDLKDDSIKEIEKELFSNQNFNIAGDYEISNRGYTERDKNIARNIKLNGQLLKGLVTEDDHPEWVDLSIEDMYDKLQQEMKKEKDQAKQDQGNSGQQGNDQGDQQQGQQGSQGSGQQQDNGEQQQSQGGGQSDSQDQSDNKQKSDQGQSGSQDGDEQSDDKQQDGQGQSGEQDKKEPKTPQIGDKGDQAQQEAEELERQANDISKELEKNDTASQDLKDQAKQVADDAKELSDDAKKDDKQKGDKKGSNDESGESGKSGESGEDGDSSSGGASGADSGKSKEADHAQNAGQDESINDRLEKIKKAFNDVKTQENALNEIENNIQKERAERSAKDLAKYRNSPIYKFTASLNKFIKKEVAVGKGNTWKRFNKKYQDSGIYKPGRAKVQNGHIPSINVYFDRSGSWGPEKTKVGAQAIATLNNYVRKGQIKINLYYFSRLVHSDQEACYAEGSTYGQPIIDHINKTKPDNVIVMTDADIDDITDGTTVPGVVWLLFKGGRSDNLIDNLHGKKSTETYDLE